MSELSKLQPTARFTGLADLYARYRPDYPTDAIDLIVARCHLGPRSLLVDVGSGPGTSSRLFAMRGIPVIGIEPNAEMRQRALESPILEGVPAPKYQEGRGEATGLPDGCADAVLAAQAFHWCDAERALPEFHRILKPDGWVVLVWNERDEQDAFTAAYGRVVRWNEQAARLESMRMAAGTPLLHSPLFEQAERVVFPHHQVMDESEVVGRALSASYAPREPTRIEVFRNELIGVFAQYQQDGKVALRYQTSVYFGQRRAARC